MAHFLAGGGFKTGRGKRFIVTTLLTSLASGIAGAIWGSGQAGKATDRLETSIHCGRSSIWRRPGPGTRKLPSTILRGC